MCGIAGILGRIDARNRAALARMSSAMLHRGPDGGGTWVGRPDAAGEGCLLAHRRLSIIDLSAAGDQPMVDPVGGQVIVFNGEVYNYRALRDELVAAGEGERLASSGDTAVLLRLLAARGPGACPRLRGMFAFGLWDDARRRLVLARDPLGIKPLYVARNPDPRGGWRLAFASEVRALLASGLLGAPRLAPAALASIVWNGFVGGPSTIVAGIEQVWPGEALTVTQEEPGAPPRVEARAFWSPTRHDGCWVEATPGELGAALRGSVREHLESDVPVGVFLSSGIDSSAVANLARQVSDAPVHTFTLAFEEAALSEAAPARRIAAAIGAEHREVVLTERRFVEALEPALDALDQPTFDGLNSFFISQAVREAGLKVALVGTGGDELFGGYASFRQLPRLCALARSTRWLPRGSTVAAARLVSAALAGRRRAQVGPQTRWAKLPDMVRAGEDLLELYQLAYALFLPGTQRELLAPDVQADGVRLGLPAPLRARLEAELRGRSLLSAVSVLELRCFLGERLLRDSDAASMAVSLELRLPLVDHRVFEVADRLPDAARYAPLGRKAALRQAGLAGLDPSLFERPKRGFVLPFEAWLRRRLGRALDDTLRDEAAARAVGLDGAAVARLWTAYREGAPGMYWSRVWALYVLLRWCQRHGVAL
ncbi:MAG: asparagine synthase (glutamine-hydrolyzing) [Planctomycetes bacterium]|nr:asparagine synthase (glutamine-hydrolyzing) [Planctomycetota bacterium]